MPKNKLSARHRIFGKYNTLILLPVGVIVLLMLSVFILGLGINKLFLNSSIEGYISSENKQPVYNAVICIDDNCTTTSDNGFYSLKDVSTGEKTLFVSSDQHLDLSQRIKLKPGNNSVSIALTEAELTNSVITFEDENGINIDNIDVTINEKTFKPEIDTEDNKLSRIILSNYKTGAYILKTNSEYYVDQTINLVFETDSPNMYNVVLEPSAKIKIITQDWLDSKAIQKAAITLPNKDTYQTGKNGEVMIDEMSIYTKELKLAQDSYLKKTVKIETLTPGVNPDLVIKMIPEGKLAYTKDTVLKRQIIISNYDGSELRQLTLEGDNYNPWIDEKNEKVFFTKTQDDKTSLIYSIDFLGEELKMISTKADLNKKFIDLVNYEKDIRVFSENEGDGVIIKSSKLDDSKTNELVNLPEKTLAGYVLATDASQLIYGISSKEGEDRKDDGIYANTLRFNRKSTVLTYGVSEEKKSIIPQALSDDGENLAVIIDGEVFLFDYSDESLNRLTNDGLTKRSFAFQPESHNLTFIREIEGKSELVLINPESKNITVLNQEARSVSNYKWISANVFCYTTDGELWISSINNLVFPQLVSRSVSL